MAAVYSGGGGGGGGGGKSTRSSIDTTTTTTVVMYRLVSSVASEAMGIGKSSEVLTVLGGKASCRRKFVLNVHLLDEEGRLVSRDMAIVASVAYAHDYSPVLRDAKPFLAEPPLFTTFNGVEFPAQDRPTRMVSGRASFKLAISLLSSKCDNRLFCICFTPQVQPSDAAANGFCCQPCYSKPIRSISRKRTQTAASAGGSLLSSHAVAAMLVNSCCEGTSSATAPTTVHAVSSSALVGGAASKSRCGGGNNGESLEQCEEHELLHELLPKCNSPASTGSDDEGPGAAPWKTRNQVQGSSRSSSVTSMHYLSPKGSAEAVQAAHTALVLYESSCPQGQTVCTSSLGNLTTTRAERFAAAAAAVHDHHHHHHHHPPNGTTVSSSMQQGGAAVSTTTCTQVSSIQDKMRMPFDSLGSTISLRLSPESGSPTSGAVTLTSESNCCIENKDPTSSRAVPQPSPILEDHDHASAKRGGPSCKGISSSSPAAALTTTTRPFRPYASIGACKLPITDFQLGMAAAAAGTASPAPAALSSFKRNLQQQQQHSNCSELGLNSSHVANLMQRVQQLRSGAAATSAAGGTTTTTAAAAAATTTTKHKLQDMMILQGFSMAPPPPCAYSPDTDMMNLGNVINDISLEEEEKSLQYIEVSLQEVSREVQRRKDELRNKRRRLLEDEARMHNIIFQSSSWIENSMSGRISL